MSEHLPEIMSAGNVYDYITDYYSGLDDVPRPFHSKAECLDFIKTRDSAIIERCKEKIKESKYGDEWVIRSILDSVLAEIEEK